MIWALSVRVCQMAGGRQDCRMSLGCHSARVRNHLSPVSPCLYRNDADRRLSIPPRLQGLRAAGEAEKGRLLRPPLVWGRALPTIPREPGMMWANGMRVRTRLGSQSVDLGCGLGLTGRCDVAGLVLSAEPARGGLDSNADVDGRRMLGQCRRTHCRYTGPFFLAMAAAVRAYITGLLALGSWPWLVLGLIIVVGNAFLWWATERVFGAYSGGYDQSN